MYPDKWCDKVLGIEKWKEKCDELEKMIKDTGIPKIANTPYMYIVPFIKKLLIESNANV